MNKRFGESKFREQKNELEIKDEMPQTEIKEEDLDRVSGGGNSAWGTLQQQPPANP